MSRCQPCFGKMDLSECYGLEEEIGRPNLILQPLRNLLQLQLLKLCSSTDRCQASVDKASWSPRVLLKVVWDPHVETRPAKPMEPWSPFKSHLSTLRPVPRTEFWADDISVINREFDFRWEIQFVGADEIF